MKVRSLLLAGAVLCSLTASAKELTLVKDGKPMAEIIMPSQAVKSVQLGALELNHHIKMITGTDLPVKTGKGTPGKVQIILGSEKPLKYEKEFTAVKFQGDQIRIFGYDSIEQGKVNYKNHNSYPNFSKSNGTLFAVYDFLEKYCGVRWYGLTDDATAFIPRKTLSVTVKDHEHTPKVDAFRGIYNSGGRNLMLSVLKYTPRDEKLMRFRWRCASFFGQTNHNVYRIYFTYWDKAKKPAYAKLFKEKRHDYFAKGYKGKMTPLDGFLRREYPNDPDCPSSVCFSSQGVIDFFTNQALEQWDGKPMVGLPSNGAYQKRTPGKPFFSSVQHQDTQGPCHCDACSAKRAKLGENNLMWQWIADIANAVAKQNPEIGISTLAYQRSLAYPDKVKLPENLCVQMCLGIHAWWNPEFYKIQHDEIYKKWMTNKGKRVMTCWLYLFGPSWDSKTRFKHKFFPGIYPENTGKIVKEMVNDGMRGYFIECEWARNMLEVYMATKMFYDPDLDVRAVLDEHFRLFYGKAGDDMKAFFTELESIYWNWKNYPASMFGKNSIAKRLRAHSLGSGMLNAANNWSVGTDERMARLSKLLASAEAKADSPLIKKRISWIRKGFWDQAVEGHKDQKRRAKILKMPEKTATILRVPDANGDFDKVDWSKGVAMEDCHTLEVGEVVPGAFQLKLQADSKYLYLEFIDNRKQNEPKMWKNFFEIFFSEKGTAPITQIALDPQTKIPLRYVTELINDVTFLKSGKFEVKLRQLENDKKWHWQMAVPLSQIGKKGMRQFRMNYRRFAPEHKLVWNKFFASAAECIGNMGYISIKDDGVKAETNDLTFNEGNIRNEIGNWHLNHGVINFTGKEKDPNTADVEMKPYDLLINTKQFPAIAGETIRISFHADGKSLPDVGIQTFRGSKQLPGARNAKKIAKGNGVYEVSIKTPEKCTSYRIVFTTGKNDAKFRLSNVTVK